MNEQHMVEVKTYLQEIKYSFSNNDIFPHPITTEHAWFIAATHQPATHQEKKCWVYIPNTDFDFATIAAIHRHPNLQSLGIHAIQTQYLSLSQTPQNPTLQEFVLWDQCIHECRQDVPFWLQRGQSNAKRFVWITDIHFSALDDEKIQSYCDQILRCQPDGILLTGDISDSSTSDQYLTQLATALKVPIYFVLGNHDFYGSSFDQVQIQMQHLCHHVPHLFWLNASDPLPLTADTGVIGHNAWNDAQGNTFLTTGGLISDYLGVQDLAQSISNDVKVRWRVLIANQGKEPLQRKLQALGVDIATILRAKLLSALSQYRHVILLTHFPPFTELNLHHGQIWIDWQPHIVCQALGQMIHEVMAQFPDHQLLALCGHVHEIGARWILPNVLALSGGVCVGEPGIQRVLELGE